MWPFLLHIMGWLGFAALSVWQILDHLARVLVVIWLWRKWRDDDDTKEGQQPEGVR